MAFVSTRIRDAARSFGPVGDFYFTSRYAARRFEPGISDFTFGNPHEMPLVGIVSAIRERAVPHDENWFAYKTSEPAPRPSEPYKVYDPVIAEVHRIREQLAREREPASSSLTLKDEPPRQG